MNVALDTNILVYAEGLNGAARRSESLQLLERLEPESTLLPVQVLGELFTVLVKKAGRSRDKARAAVLEWGDAFPLIETSSDVLLRAMDLAVDHQLFVWDAVILASAAEAHCRILLSEDLQDGFTWSGVTIVNPFRTPHHSLLARAIR
jgi:predicted nucleic acid-binding protein